jgi:hypothetical protein
MSNSWLPYAVASMPQAFATSIAGRSSRSAELGGDRRRLVGRRDLLEGAGRVPPGEVEIDLQRSAVCGVDGSDDVSPRVDGYPGWDSNPHWMQFECIVSAVGLPGRDRRKP